MRWRNVVVGVLFSTVLSADAAYYEARDYSTPRYIVDNEGSENPDRAISFYSGYLQSQLNAYDLTTFGLELLNGADYLLRKLDSHPVAKKFGAGLFAYIYYSYQLALHEIGHGLRIRAHDKPYQLNLSSEKNRKFEKDESFWSYLFRGILRFNTSGSTVYEATGFVDPKIDAREGMVVAAGGINHETYLAERIADAIWTDKLHGGMLPIAAYVWARMSPLLYTFNTSDSPENDINNIEQYAKTREMSVTRSNMQTAYVLGLIGGTAYSMICHAMSNGYNINTVTFGGFRIPDMFPYVTSYGVSYKFVSGYKFSNQLSLNFSYERVFNGQKKHEFSFGANCNFNIIDVSSNVYFGCVGFGLDATASFRITEKFSVNCRIASYPTRGLMGERHSKKYFDTYETNGETDNVKERARNNMVSFGVSYWYGR